MEKDSLTLPLYHQTHSGVPQSLSARLDLNRTQKQRDVTEHGKDEDGVALNCLGNRNSCRIQLPWILKSGGPKALKTEYFIPTLVCFVFKSIGNAQLQEMIISVVYTLFIRYDFSMVPEEYWGHIRDNIKFLVDDKEVDPGFNENKNPVNRSSFQATYRSSEEVFYFNPDLTKLPFDTPTIRLKFELQSVALGKDIVFRFNCLVKDEFLGNVGQITYRDNCDRVPEYNFALLETTIERPAAIKKLPFKKGDSINQVEIIGPGNLKGERTFVQGDVYVHYPVTTVNIQCYREPEYLIFSIVVPLILINLFTLTIFLLDSSDIGTKLGILVTILLALFAFTFSVRQSLPSVPYLTDLEKQIVLSLVVMFIAATETIVGFLAEPDIGEVTKSVCGLLATIIVVATLVVFTVHYIHYRRECNEYEKQNERFLKHEKEKDSQQVDFTFDKNCIGRGLLLSAKTFQDAMYKDQ